MGGVLLTTYTKFTFSEFRVCVRAIFAFGAGYKLGERYELGELETSPGASRRPRGLAALYGDSMITPAISVISAVEGLGIATPVLNRFVLPLTIIVLLALFLLQKGGTGCVRFGGGRRIERIEVVEIRYGAPD